MIPRFLLLSLGALLAASSAAPPATPAPKFKAGIGLTEVPGQGQDAASAEAQRLSKQAAEEFNRGDLVIARGHFVQALALAPENAAILINLALLDYRDKQYVAAETRLKHVLGKQPEAGLAWFLLGVVYYDQEKLDPALGALAQAAVFDPQDARVHHYLGVTIGRKGWYLGAEDEMRKAIQLQPDYAEAHFNLAVFYLQRTPPAVELARRHYQKALELGAAPDPQIDKTLQQ